jgi:uncharacterized short protein YbdD (DUF466 family)
MSLGSDYGDAYDDYCEQFKLLSMPDEQPMTFTEFVNEESQRQRYKYEDLAEDRGTERE